MRIAQFIDTPGVGGAETVVIEISNALRTQGIECYILYFEEGFVYQRAKDLSLPLIQLPNFKAYQSSFSLPKFVLALNSILRSNNIDLIHSHLLGPIIASSFTSLLSNIKHVGTLHDSFIVNQNPLNWRLLQLSTLLGTRLVTVSKDMQHYYQTTHWFRNKTIQTIYNGVSEYTKNIVSSNIIKREINPDNKIIITCVARLVPLKQQNLLIEAISQMKTRENVRLVLVGNGSEESSLRTCAKQLGVSNNILFLGNRADVDSILGCSDIFAITSSTEGLSRSIIEAMAASLPIVTNNVGGNRELVEDGKNGFLLTNSDSKLIATSLDVLSEDSKLRATMGNNSKNKALNIFSTKTMAQKYVELYKELLQI